MTWFLVALMVLGLAAWGWRQAGSAAAYFAASRRAGPLLAGLGGTAAGLSAFVFVGGPGLFAALGAASVWIIFSAPITGALQCWAVGEPIMAMARRHRCLTVPGLLAARFGEGWPRGLAAAAVAAGGVATLTVQIKGSAVIGEILLGVPGWQVAAVAVLATVAYTAAGGMGAGLFAEAIQGVIMAGAAVGLAVMALVRAGGPVAALATITQQRPELLDPWTVGPVTAIGWFLLFALGTCAQPHYLHKFLMLRDQASLRWLPAVMTAALLAVLTVWLGVGVGGTALWLQGDLDLAAPDQLAPALLGSGPAWLGVLGAIAVVAAVMSTAASLLNLVAAAVVRDLPRALGLPIPQGLTAARLATVAAAATAGLLGLNTQQPVALLGILGWGMFTAALLPAVLLGLNWQGAARRGAIASLLLGPAVQLSLELARLAGYGIGAWEPGLTGAAAGVLVLVLLSRRVPEQRPLAQEGES